MTPKDEIIELAVDCGLIQFKYSGMSEREELIQFYKTAYKNGAAQAARDPLTDEQRSWIVATCVTPRQIIDLVENMHGIKGEA